MDDDQQSEDDLLILLREELSRLRSRVVGLEAQLEAQQQAPLLTSRTAESDASEDIETLSSLREEVSCEVPVAALDELAAGVETCRKRVAAAAAAAGADKDAGEDGGKDDRR